MRQPFLSDSSSDSPQEKEHVKEEYGNSSSSRSSSSSSYDSSLIMYLYIGHFLARWGARMWEFSVALYMIHIFPDSLLLTAVYGVVESASAVLFGPLVGRLVDRLTYIQVLRLWVLTQNLSFVVAGTTVTVLLVSSTLRLTNFATFISLVILTNISGAVGVLSTLAGTILIEREWVVVISAGYSPESLTNMNSNIRRIDLVCKLLAPVLSGFIISFISLKDSAVTFTLWNIISVSVIYWLFISVYHGIPSLSNNNDKRNATNPQNDSLNSLPNLEERESLLSQERNDSAVDGRGWSHELIERFSNFPFVSEWKVYLRQDVVLPGIAISLLYCTVLSFGTLMTATLEWEGIPVYVISLMRGVSATVGISATLLYPVLHSRISTLRTGLWSIWTQWTFLLVCVASIWVRKSHLSSWLLMVGVAASRLGLWMFDLSVMQQMQDQVSDSERCIVGGVQNSLQSIFDLLTYTMGIIISNPQDFWKLDIMSFFLVSLAAVLYSFHIYRIRKHLFHFEKIVSKVQWLIQ